MTIWLLKLDYLVYWKDNIGIVIYITEKNLEDRFSTRFSQKSTVKKPLHVTAIEDINQSYANTCFYLTKMLYSLPVLYQVS